MSKQTVIQPAENSAPANVPPPPVPFWSTIYGYIRPDRGKLILAMVCAAFVGVAIALQPIVIKFIIDGGILRKTATGEAATSEERLRWTLIFAGVYLFLSLSRVTIWMAGYRGMVRAIEAFIFRLRARFFKHVQRLCLRFHDQVSSGELFNYIMGSPAQSLKTFLQQGSMSIPYQIVSWVVTVGALAIFNLWMTLISLAIMAAVVWLNYRSRFVIREMSAEFMQTESSVSKYVADMLRGARAVKIYAMEDDVDYTFESQVEKIRAQGERLARRQQLEGIKPEVVQYFGMTVIYAVGGWFCIQGSMKVGVFMAFVASINQLMGPLMALLQLNLIRANAEAGLERIVRILEVKQSTPELPPEARTPVEAQASLARDVALPCILMQDVDFAYEPGKSVFRKLSCRIEDGQSVALVGPSGSGKSSFVSLLLRFYEVDAGRILLNGQDLKNYSLSELRSAFGVVPQAPFIFQATILDNIRVARPDATEEEVRAACELAYVNEFVDAMPQGFKTWIGENGFNLSGGQRQRLAIARAALANPRYFIFDEATSALDNQSERRIQTAMERIMNGHTSIIVAHRLSTIRNVDRILVFDQGRIVQDGTYAQLAECPGVFKHLLASADEGDDQSP
jgi:ABC-type multidrug transport system fused ATPase/permease subunit